jgi:flagellar motor switch protein FliG
MGVSPQIAEKLSPRKKAALLLLSLDVATAKAVMRQLTQEELESAMVEIAAMKESPQQMVDQVLDEFHAMLTSNDRGVRGGLDPARHLLEQTLGMPKATDVLERVKTLTNVRGFGVLKKADAQQLAGFLMKEHPQTIALILSNLSPDQSARVLSQFPEELRNSVTFRMATLGKVSPALLTEVEGVVEEIAELEISQSMSSLGGAKPIANVLNRVSTADAREILGFIEERDPSLCTDIKRLMFIFQDLIYIDDRGIQRVLREVDKKDLAMALKVVDEDLKTKIFKNMSERAQDLLKEELQYMGPVRLKEVEAAQGRIVEVVKQLEEQGEIVVAGRGGSEDVLV